MQGGRMRWAILGLIIIAAPPAWAQSQDPETHSQDETELIDDFRTGLTNSVNATAAWLDSFFAESVNPDDYDTARGSLTLTPEWDEHDGFKLDSSFRATVVFPHAERKFSAIIGRGDFDDFINDSKQSRPSVIQRDQSDEEWMVGLGFDPFVEDNHSLSFGAGFRGGLN